MTNDQYLGLHKLVKWYNKYQNQIIEVSGVVGTGIWDLIQEFIKHVELDIKEIMWLSYDQRQVLEMAYKKYHTYYINNIIYKYTKFVDFSTLPVINPKSNEMKYTWKKEVRDKIDIRYKLIVVFDSILLNYETLNDLSSFGIPIILLRDPMLLPASDSHTFLKDANIVLQDISPEHIRFPITYFAQRVLNGEKLISGNYDCVSIVTKNQMNLYNIHSSDMNIVISDDMKDNINQIYREKILKQKNITNIPGERVIISETLYGHKLVNKDEKKIKLYLTKGTVGKLSKINKHAMNTKYVPIEFTPEFYQESFKELILDRHYLNKINLPSTQLIPDETLQTEYAYALTPVLARYSNWDKVTLIIDNDEDLDEEIFRRFLYTAITRSKKSLTIII